MEARRSSQVSHSTVNRDIVWNDCIQLQIGHNPVAHFIRRSFYTQLPFNCWWEKEKLWLLALGWNFCFHHHSLLWTMIRYTLGKKKRKKVRSTLRNLQWEDLFLLIFEISQKSFAMFFSPTPDGFSVDWVCAKNGTASGLGLRISIQKELPPELMYWRGPTEGRHSTFP